MTTYTNTQEAIERSRSHNEIVTVEASDIDAVTGIACEQDGDYDSVQIEPGAYDVWGWTSEEGDGEMDWRLTVRIVGASVIECRDSLSGESFSVADDDSIEDSIRQNIADGLCVGETVEYDVTTDDGRNFFGKATG
jgi:hypothetical protein